LLKDAPENRLILGILYSSWSSSKARRHFSLERNDKLKYSSRHHISHFSFIRQLDVFGLAGTKLVMVASLTEMRGRSWKRNCRIPLH